MCYSIDLNQRINFLHFVCIETKQTRTKTNHQNMKKCKKLKCFLQIYKWHQITTTSKINNK